MLPVNNTCEENETGMRRVYIRKAQREMREGQMEGGRGRTREEGDAALLYPVYKICDRILKIQIIIHGSPTSA